MIIQILRKNNYPIEEIWKFIRKHHFIKHKRQELLVVAENNDNEAENIYHSITYVEGLTERINKEIRKLGSDTKMANKVCNTLSMVFTKTKDRIATVDKNNVIYKIDCGDCNKVYIGQTSKKLETRITQHGKDVERQSTWKERLSNAPLRMKDDEILSKVTPNQTALVKHAVTLNHNFKFDNATIIDKHDLTKKREFIESAHIHMHQNTVNYKQDLMKIYPSYYNIVNYYSNNNDKSPNKAKDKM